MANRTAGVTSQSMVIPYQPLFGTTIVWRVCHAANTSAVLCLCLSEDGTGFVRLSLGGSAHIPARCVLKVMKVCLMIKTLKELYSGSQNCVLCQQLAEEPTRFFFSSTCSA